MRDRTCKKMPALQVSGERAWSPRKERYDGGGEAGSGGLFVWGFRRESHRRVFEQTQFHPQTGQQVQRKG